MTVEALCDAAAASADGAGFLPLSGLPDRGVVEELRRVRQVITRWEARSADLVGEAERRGIPQEEGFGSASGWLIAVTGDPPAVCRSRVGVARTLREMPLTREVFASGGLSEPRVRLLTDACRFAPRAFARDEVVLVAQARTLPARLFPQVLSHWRRLADAAGAVAEAERAFERRRLHVSATWAGMVRLDGDLDPESGSLVMTALASLAEPAALAREDRRTPAQRRADALVEICRRHLDTSDRPVVGGERPHLAVTVDLATLAGRGEPLADLDTGPITLEALGRLACDATLTPVITGPDGQPRAVGSNRRAVPPSLRRVLY